MRAVRVLVVDPVDPRLGVCLELRRRVFSGEQGVPVEIESDGRDPECSHVMAVDARGQVLGTARLRVDVYGCAKAERVAVSADARGLGVGRALMEQLEELAASRGHDTLRLGAQVAVSGFYTRLGYVPVGPRYVEAGIEHQTMVRPLLADSRPGEGAVEG